MRDMKGPQPIRPGMGIGLEPRVEDALSHPLRREIVRILNTDGRPRTLDGLSAALPSFTVSEVNYHVLVLRGAGVIISDSTAPAPSGRHRAYRSVIAEDASVLAVMRVNERSDRELLRLAFQRSKTGLLSMFRAPRPVRSVRLGARRKPGPEPRG